MTADSSGEISFRILTCYYRPKPGGFCKRLFRGINALLAKGHTVHYLAVVPFPIEHPNCHFHHFPWPEERTSGYLFWGCFHLLAPLLLLYIGFRHQISHLFAFGHTYALFLQPLRLLKRIPLTLFLRGDALEKHKIGGRSKLLVTVDRILEGFGMTGARMCGVSETLMRKANARHRCLHPLECRVLRNDIAQYPAARNKRETRHLRTACVGILETGKNQRLLLEVFKNIQAEQAQLHLYGVGTEERSLQEMAEQEKMTDRVHFMGWVPSENIWPEVDLLLMPSLHEGAPNAVLEAIGSGTPVLASDIPEHHEILPGSCLLPLNDPEKWREKIRIIATDSKIYLHVLYEQEHIAEQLRFDWDGMFVRCVII